MFTEDKITEIFCLADDFCKVFNQELRTRQLKDGSKLCGDKGDINKRLFDFLFMDGVQLITKIKSNTFKTSLFRQLLY